MRLITSCPACSTRFKLVPDQLKISEGWVRCGQCNEIFDASIRLEPVTPSLAHPGQFPVLTESASASLSAAMPPVAAPQPDIPSASEPPPQARPNAEPVPAPEPVPADDTSILSEFPTDIHTDIPADWQVSSSVADALYPDQANLLPQPDVEPEFVKKAKRRERWSHPAVRGVLALLVLFLSAALAAQVLMDQRDRIVATQPDLAPVVHTLCEWTDCQVRPYRDADAIVIDATRFTKLAQSGATEVFQLDVTLKNKASHTVAAPALELSLTNSRDETIVRKVFLPSHWGKHAEMPALAEWPVSLALKVQPGGSSPIGGYRIAVFHP